MAFIGKGRPGGPGGNKVMATFPDDATRKARPKKELGDIQSTGTNSVGNDVTRKARPKGSGSGQSTNTK